MKKRKVGPFRWPGRKRKKAEAVRPSFEAVEPRLLLTSAPFFVTPVTDQFLTTDGALTFGIDGGDADGDALTITATSDRPNDISVYVPQGNRFARLYFRNIVNGPVVSEGSILLQLFDDRSPTATERFVRLSTDPDAPAGIGGEPFYTDVVVHRVVPNFVIQTGDKKNGNGTGGSDLGKFNNSFDPVLSFAGKGVLAMANSGPNTNDSQWFVTAGPTPHLNQKHMIFGQMISGSDVFDKIISTPRDGNDRPLSPPILENVEILSAAQNAQDNTITIRALNGYLGDANVTIRIDDGTPGGVTETTIKISSLGALPVITPAGPLKADAQHPLIFNVTDDGNRPLSLVGQKSPANVAINADNANKRFTFTVPNNFTGLSRLVLSAEEAGFPARVENTQLYHVLSQNPGDPPVLGRATPNTAGTALATQQVGNLLYVANGQRGLEIWNLANPASPVRLGTSQTLGIFRDVKVVNNVAFAAFNNGPSGTEAGLLAFNVTNPASITFMSGGLTTGDAISLAVDGNFAYVAADDAGLTVFNVLQMLDGDNNTNTITKVGTLKNIEAGVIIGRAVGVTKLGNTLFISDAENGGVIVMNAPTPTNMTLRGRILTPNTPFGITSANNRLYVIDQDDGLMVFDVTDSTNIGFMGLFPISGLPSQVTLFGSIAIVATTNDFLFVDVSDPALMTLSYRFNGPFGAGIASVSGNRLALPLGSDGVILMDGDLLDDIVSFQGKQTFTDSNNVLVTIDVKNATARVTREADGDISKLEILGSNEKTTVTIKTKGGETTIGDVLFYGRAKSFVASTTDLGGNFIANSAVLKVQFDDIAGNHQIQIGGSTNPKDALTFVADEVRDTDLDVDIPIKSITATFLLNTDAQNDTISSSWLGKLTTKGNKKLLLPGHFQADLVLSGAGNPKSTLGGAKVAGTLGGEWEINGPVGAVAADAIDDWTAQVTGLLKSVKVNQSIDDTTLTANILEKLDVKQNLTDTTIRLLMPFNAADTKAVAMKSMKVKGTADGVTLRSESNVGKIEMGMAFNTNLFAGMLDVVNALPSAPAQYEHHASIAGVKVKGVKGVATWMGNVNIGAWNLGKIDFGFADTDNDDILFGVAGHTIAGVSYKDAQGTLKATTPQAIGGWTPIGDLVVRLV